MRLKFFILFVFLNCEKQNNSVSPLIYDPLVIADHPIAFWNNSSGKDASTSHRDGILVNRPSATMMPNGDQALDFNGVDQYMEVPTDPVFSVPATKILTIEAWMRADILDFAQSEGSGYVYWLGKGATGQQEYAARMYGQHPTGHDSNRINRISGYVFNSSGGLGAGSYYQAPANSLLKQTEWMLYVLIINIDNAVFSSKYPTGHTKLYLIRQNSDKSLNINEAQDALISYNIVPVAGNAPFRVGTRNFSSFFKGAVGKVAIYNYELDAGEIANHANNMFQIK